MNKNFSINKQNVGKIIKDEFDERAVYSSLLVILVMKLFSVVTDVQKRFNKVKIQETKEKRERYLVYAMKIFKSKMRTYFILITIFSLYYTYFLIIFTNIFPYTQKSWIISSLISIAINAIIIFGLCLLYTCLRIFSLNKEISWLYAFATFAYSIF